MAVAALRKTIEIYIKKGRFRQAADRSKEIGQIFQQDGGDLKGALEAFDQAGEWYSQEDAAACALTFAQMHGLEHLADGQETTGPRTHASRTSPTSRRNWKTIPSPSNATRPSPKRRSSRR